MTVIYKPYICKRILNKYKNPDAWFLCRYSAHPYIGCEHACEYCYAREDKYLQFDDLEDYSRIIKVKTNAPEILKKELSKIKKKEIICTGDYQPADKKFELEKNT